MLLYSFLTPPAPLNRLWLNFIDLYILFPDYPTKIILTTHEKDRFLNLFNSDRITKSTYIITPIALKIRFCMLPTI